MLHVLRETWSWRGGLSGHELLYDPVLGDALAAPIQAPATQGWPLLVSDDEIAALLAGGGAEPAEIAAALGLYLLLTRRAGGYHAFVPEVDETVATQFAALRVDDDVPDRKDAVRLLIGVGALERTRGRLALRRPEVPGLADLQAARTMLTKLEFEAPVDSLARRAARLAWVLQADGLGRRFRELARCGRLAVRVLGPDPSFTDPNGYLRVGPRALPALSSDVARDIDDLHPARGFIATAHLTIDDGDRPGSPLLLGTYEVAALLLGEERSVSALRRAVRAAALWTLLARRTSGATGTVETSVAALTPEFAELVGLNPCGDHRRLVAHLLDDLVAAAVVHRRQSSRGSTSIELRRPPAPSDRAVRHLLGAWKVWVLTDPEGCRERHRQTVAVAWAHLLEHVREPWAALMEAGRISVRVLPAADAT